MDSTIVAILGTVVHISLFMVATVGGKSQDSSAPVPTLVSNGYLNTEAIYGTGRINLNQEAGTRWKKIAKLKKSYVHSIDLFQ